MVVSYIGMLTVEEAVKPEMRIVLRPTSQQLDEVVVTVAYGTAKRESITGAVSAIDTKDIEIRPVTSVAGALEGKTTGIQINNTYGEPGSNPTIRIRGFGSINGNNDPLYVIDGVPFGGNISDLNTNDIESLSVLKDASSSALYGNRASNGVILITTKKGKSDRLNVRANIKQGIYQRGIPEYERLNADEFMETMWTGYRNSLISTLSDTYPTVEAANAAASATLVSDILKYNIYNKPEDALFDANGKLVAGAQILDGYKDDLDWYKDAERLGYRQDYTFSADAASDKASYFFSLGYLDEKGYIKTSDFQRWTGRANVDITPKKWFKAGFTLSASHQVSNSTTGSASDANSYVNPFMYARNIAPIYPVHLHDMETGEYILDDNGNIQYDGGDTYGRAQYNGRHVIWENELDMDRTFRNTAQGMAYADIYFLNNFTFTIKGDINLRNSENQSYDNPTIGNGAGQGRAKRIHYRYKNFTFQQQLMWNKKIKDHSIDVLLGHENYNYNYSYQYGYKTTLTFDGNTELNNFSKKSALDGYQNNYRTESYLGRLRYNYNSKYYFDASFRRDGSSRFHPDNRWGNFWSVGGSWSIMREDFMNSLEDKINSLRLRASYGEVGNDAGVGYYGYLPLYALDTNGEQGAVYKTQNAAPDIKWETTSSFGVALEGRIFDRANFTFEYFDKRSKDLLFDVYLPLSAGATSIDDAEATITKNLGSVSNRGFEMNVDVDIIKNNDWIWNVGVNATFLKNKILKLPEENREDGIINGTKRYLEGHGIYDFWMYQYVGVDQMTGNSLYLPNLDEYYVGEPMPGKKALPSDYLVKIGDQYYTTYTTYAKKDWSGSAIPKVYGSFSTALSYKNFDLNALFTYAIGGKTLDYSYQSLMSVTSNPNAIHRDILKSWSGVPEGMTETSPNRIDPEGIPVIDYDRSSKNNATSTRFLQDASYLVVKNVTLAYNLPKPFVKKLDLSNIAVNLSIENLATLTGLKGMNPQQSFSGTNNNAFVTARVYSLGISVSL